MLWGSVLSLSLSAALALPRTLGEDGFLSPVARITAAKLPAGRKGLLLLKNQNSFCLFYYFVLALCVFLCRLTAPFN